MHLTARRTTLRPGRELDYERVHATIPEPVARALRRAGVLRWTIWRDGSHLFHTIETRDGYPAMLAALAPMGPLDPAWDALIASLLEPGEGADVVLPAVWSLDGTSQGPFDGVTR
jgi:L-rhamnose mutarotase